MELSDVARRRMHRIACHMGARQQTTSSGSLATLVCSAGSGVPHSSRKDNRLFYARQGSHTQAFYMRPNSGNQVAFSNEEECDAPLQCFEASNSGGSSGVTHANAKTELQHRDPLFGKPVSDSKGVQEYGGLTSDEGPLFARMADDSDDKMKSTELVQNNRRQFSNKTIGLEWCPRMDVAESGSAYVVTVELPGVNVDGIRVEVDNNRLIVTGTRSTEWWVGLNKIDGGAIYHRKELSQGPYRVVWHIPDDSNTDSITAEFIDGFLRVLVPKIFS